MGIEKDRLLSIIDFAQHSARLRSRPALTVAGYQAFVLWEAQVRTLPGVALNADADSNSDERWLVVERLHETRPPKDVGPVLRPWLVLHAGPDKQPELSVSILGSDLIAAGTHRSSRDRSRSALPSVTPDATVPMNSFLNAPAVRGQLTQYIDTKWQPWARAERLRREAIKLYSQLFKVQQQQAGNVGDTPMELVWGVGVASWELPEGTVMYPLITRRVEISIDRDSARLEVRPREAGARLELEWASHLEGAGVGDLEQAAKTFFGAATTTFSPFDRGTFEPVLRSASTHLHDHGAYWPEHAQPGDRSVPKAERNLRVTDTWVLFARPRTASILIEDLLKLRSRTEEASDLPAAVAELVTEPSEDASDPELPAFRGAYSSSPRGSTPQELYFPKPYNAEQIRIIQLLEKSDGVVVQGPPGTGKTHTIANVVCHYLALGKRVLVTSMKDPALKEVQEKLPPDIRPLAISLLSSEHQGLQQFEHAVNRIAAEVQSLDRVATQKDIRDLDARIESLHGQLSAIDHQVTDWATRNLTNIELDGETIRPEEAARQVVDSLDYLGWLPDLIGVGSEHSPQFGDVEVTRLREARRELGVDIGYLGASLPLGADFPDPRTMLSVHQDLSQHERLKREVASGDVPVLAGGDDEVFTLAHELAERTRQLRTERAELLTGESDWRQDVRSKLRTGGLDQLLGEVDALQAEASRVGARHTALLSRPVLLPEGAEFDSDLTEAIGRLSEGKRAFGLSGLLGKSEQKNRLKSIRVLGRVPEDVEAWEHVESYLSVRTALSAISIRWNALASELPLQRLSGEGADDGLAAIRSIDFLRRIRTLVELESSCLADATTLFPSVQFSAEILDGTKGLDSLAAYLNHHLTRRRLESTWSNKEKCLDVLTSRRGAISQSLRQFISAQLGSPELLDTDMQTAWSELLAELSRVHGLSTHLNTVAEVTESISASGAPLLAEELRKPMLGTIDPLLPSTWRSKWRLRRLATHLDSIEGAQQLREFSAKREVAASDLAKSYEMVVVKRTWLRLAENASPSTKAALAAYLTAILKLRGGTGSGKRAIRYRKDAQVAADKASTAVPCWIMAHYRVSESLPAELGIFDLVIIDEASQSDLTALPALLRAKKLLVVGDDKQVSPEGIGLEEAKVRALMSRFLADQVSTYGAQLSPERSIYDLCKVVFARSAVMLREHFRCVPAIIEYSRREHYEYEIRPLRIPRSSERLDPPLVDVRVDGYRDGHRNRAEAAFIVEEIKAIVSNGAMNSRSIGVVSLLGGEQADTIWDQLKEELGPEVMQRHNITCGDAREFQGKERSIMFLSMVIAPNNLGIALGAKDTFRQRFNVAASRAQDRMYLVRSVDASQLSNADTLRKGLLGHFDSPFQQDEQRASDMRGNCESEFEKDVYDCLVERGFRVVPQVKVGRYRIDMVVEGHNDTRLAIECDGDRYHGPDKWEDDMSRQRDLERAGWRFWRCFASTFVRRREETIADLVATLTRHGVEPIGAEGAPQSIHVERRRVPAATGQTAHGE